MDMFAVVVFEIPIPTFSEPRNLVFALAVNSSPSGRGTSKARFSPLLRHREGVGG